MILNFPTLWIGFVATLLLGSSLSAAELKIQLPQETGFFAPGVHAEIANAQCLICHSVEYVTTQPPLSRAAWKASVEKMQQKYGAPIPAEQVTPLVDYLVKNYGVESTNFKNLPPAANPPVPIRIPLLSEQPSPQREVGVALAARYGCTGCHNPNVKIVGPAFKQIASKYRNDPRAAEAIAQQITQGGGGKWGSIPMPPFPAIPRLELETLTRWILDESRLR